jgi:hypothetical protein
MEKIKMRVMYASSNKKMANYADAIGHAFGCSVNDIPPSYPCDNERLVVIGLSLRGSRVEDRVRRFCTELIPTRARATALFIEGEPGSAAEKEIVEILKNAGTNFIDHTMYLKCGLFSSKLSLEERQKIVDWVREVYSIATNG